MFYVYIHSILFIHISIYLSIYLYIYIYIFNVLIKIVSDTEIKEKFSGILAVSLIPVVGVITFSLL